MDHSNGRLSQEAKRFRWVLLFVLGVIIYRCLPPNMVIIDLVFLRLSYEAMLIIGLIFFALGYHVIIVNILGVLTAWIKKKSYSSIPILGGVFLATGMLMIPHPLLNRLFWIAFLVDYTWPMFIWFLIYMTTEKYWNDVKK